MSVRAFLVAGACLSSRATVYWQSAEVAVKFSENRNASSFKFVVKQSLHVGLGRSLRI